MMDDDGDPDHGAVDLNHANGDQTVHTTRLGPNGMLVQFGQDGNDSGSLNPRKRAKVDNASETLHTVGGISSVLEQVEENVIPVVDSAGICTACFENVQPDVLLSCCSCAKKFHALCAELQPLANRGVKITPARTYIKHFNTIMAVNKGYLGGKFSWNCNSCVSVRALADNKFLGDRLAMVESAIAQQRPLLPLLKKLATNSENWANSGQRVASVNSVASTLNNNVGMMGPVDKAAQGSIPYNVVASGSVCKGHSADGSTNALGHQKSLSSNDRSTFAKSNSVLPKPVKKFRITLSNDKEGPPIRKILGEKAASGSLADYDYKSYGKNSMDLLFNSMAEAEIEHKKLVGNLAGLQVSTPDMNRSRKAYLVGLADYHDVDSVSNFIQKRYGNDLKLNDINKNCLKVISVDPCAKDRTLFRATLQLSEDVLNIISKVFNNRLRVSYASCRLYPVQPHRRCHKCQEHGHIKRNCKQEKPTCAQCAGDHYTDECIASVEDGLKCVNCFKSDDFKNRCSHSANSSQCPVFLAYRSKNDQKN